MTACIVGWSHTKFGKHESEDIESLIVKVATEAIHDAGLAPADIDEIFIGTGRLTVAPKRGGTVVLCGGGVDADMAQCSVVEAREIRGRCLGRSAR